MKQSKFSELNLSKDLFKAISEMKFENATPIQAEAIPEILTGVDVIGQASTGTGKTAAFSIPAIEKINPKEKLLQTLILCPTRELAIQVANEIKKLLKYKKGISVVAVYGGQPIERQLYSLRKGPQIVVGTPGRTLDHLERGTITLRNLKMFILDEADEMLNMGFRQDIETILSVTPEERQVVLFSATMSPEILRLTKKYQKKPKHVKVAPRKMDISAIEQIYFSVEGQKKSNLLMDLINSHKPKLSIIFCNTKRKVDKVARTLSSRGFLAEGIHGDIRQSKRDRIMSKFRKSRINILVATDVAARGIDVNDVEAVFNYEIPRDVELYVHRIGRTGRAGKKGKAFSLVSREENYRLNAIKRFTKTEITKEVASFDSTERKESKEKRGSGKIEEKSKEVFKKVRRYLYEEELGPYLNIVKKVLGKKSNNKKENSHDFAAALLKIVVEQDRKNIQ